MHDFLLATYSYGVLPIIVGVVLALVVRYLR